jgi:two-component system chemotaxis sensor kinase CheA
MGAWSWFERILHAGAAGVPEPRERRRVVLNNGIALICGSCAAFYAVLLAALGHVGLGLGLLAILSLHLGTIALNVLGRYSFSKALLLVNANTSTFIYFVALGLRAEVSLFYAAVCLPLIVCALKERRLILGGIALSVGYGVAMVALAHRLAHPWLPPPVEYTLRVTLVAMTFAILLAAVLSFVVSNARAERELELARTAVQRLLDSVAQGFVTLDSKGCIGRERSQVFDRWFGAPPAETPFAACLSPLDETVGGTFELIWSEIEEGFMPPEVLLDQLPQKLDHGGHNYRLKYQPELAGDRIRNVLVVISDVTAELERERAEDQQRELLSLLGRFTADRCGFREFLREADDIVESLLRPGLDLTQMRRALHTLKGNCAQFGARTLAAYCHDVETRLAEGEDSISHGDAERLSHMWAELRERVQVFVGDDSTALAIDRAELEDLKRRVLSGATARELSLMLDTLTWESAKKRLLRIGEQASALATRLNKGQIEVEIDDGGLRLLADHWAGFWTCFTHVVRNAVDHGIERPEERSARGKPAPHVTLRTRLSGPLLYIEIADDGRGIDWQEVERKAVERGFPTGSREALKDLLFHDGFSTRDEVTALSGRGVGLSAVRHACERLGGRISLESELGHGTLFRFSFPAHGVAASRAHAAMPPTA